MQVPRHASVTGAPRARVVVDISPRSLCDTRCACVVCVLYVSATERATCDTVRRRLPEASRDGVFA